MLINIVNSWSHLALLIPLPHPFTLLYMFFNHTTSQLIYYAYYFIPLRKNVSITRTTIWACLTHQRTFVYLEQCKAQTYNKYLLNKLLGSANIYKHSKLVILQMSVCPACSLP